MATVFETAEDENREQLVANFLEKSWQCQAVRQPKFANIDLGLERDGIIKAWVEVKHCNFKFGSISQYMISSNKINAARAIFERTGKPVFLVVKWPDRHTYIQLHDLIPDRELKQWHNDRKKFEMVSWFFIARFKTIKPKLP